MRDAIHELGHAHFQLDEKSAKAHEVSSLTAPIFDARGRVELALTLQVFERDLSSREIDALGARLARSTRAIAKKSAGATRA